MEGPPFVGDIEELGVLRVDGVIGLRVRGEQALEIAGAVDMEGEGGLDGGDEGGFGRAAEESEEVIGEGLGVLALMVRIVQKEIDGGVHGTEELFNSLGLVEGSDSEEAFAVERGLDGLGLGEETFVGGDEFVPDEDLDPEGIDAEEAGAVAVRRGDGVTVGFEGDEGGFGDGGGDLAAGFVGELGEGLEAFFLEGLDGRPGGGAVGSGVAFLAPAAEAAVEVVKVVEGVGFEAGGGVLNDPFDTSFFVGPAGGAGPGGEAIVAGEVEESGVVGDLGLSAGDDGFEVVVAVGAGDAPDLAEGLDVAFEEELHRASWEEVSVEVARVGQQIDKAIDDAEGQTALHPVNLGLLAGQEGQLVVERHLALSPKAPGVAFDRGVAAREPVALEPLEDLDGLEPRIVPVPLLDQAGIGVQETLARGRTLARGPTEKTGDFLARNAQGLGRLGQAQPLDLPQMLCATPECFVHGTIPPRCEISPV